VVATNQRMAGKLTVKLEGSVEGIPEDVTFTFPAEGGAALSAHSFVLAVASDAFKANFFGGRPREQVVAIVDTSRAAFAMFLDLLYGRDVSLEELDLPRLLALSRLEDKYITNQRRVLQVVAERSWTPEDAIEVLDLDVSEEFAEAVGEAMEGTLKKQREERVQLGSSMDMDWESYYDVDSVRRKFEACMDLANKAKALVEQTQMEGSRLEEVRAKLEGEYQAPPTQLKMCEGSEEAAGKDEHNNRQETGIEHWLEETKLEKSRVEKFCHMIVAREEQLELKLQLLEAVQQFPEEIRRSIDQQMNQLQEAQKEEIDGIYQQQELEFHVRQEMALELQVKQKLLQMEKFQVLLQQAGRQVLQQFQQVLQQQLLVLQE